MNTLTTSTRLLHYHTLFQKNVTILSAIRYSVPCVTLL